MIQEYNHQLVQLDNQGAERPSDQEQILIPSNQSPLKAVVVTDDNRPAIAFPWATPEYAAQNKQALREFQERRELYFHSEELLKEALGKPWHPYLPQDGRIGQLPFSRSDFFNTMRMMFSVTKDLKFRNQRGRFDSLGWRRTSWPELLQLTDGTISEIREWLRGFEAAGIISRRRMHLPEQRINVLCLFLHGARLLELLDTVIERKRLAKAARYSSQPASAHEAPTMEVLR